VILDYKILQTSLLIYQIDYFNTFQKLHFIYLCHLFIYLFTYLFLPISFSLFYFQEVFLCNTHIQHISLNSHA
jgi:hypothetical protein